MRDVLQLLLLAVAAAADDSSQGAAYSAGFRGEDPNIDIGPIGRSTEPRLEVAKVMQRHDEHANGHPNTTVAWSNGTSLTREQASSLATSFVLNRRAGPEPLIDMAIWGGSQTKVTTKTAVAGFTGACLAFLFKAGASWLTKGTSQASTKTTNNGGSSSKVRRTPYEQNVYYQQTVSIVPGTGKWPTTNEMQGGIRIALQDMANRDLQGGCYDMAAQSVGEECYEAVFATMGFCTWTGIGLCNTPACGGKIGGTYGGGGCWGDNDVVNAGTE